MNQNQFNRYTKVSMKILENLNKALEKIFVERAAMEERSSTQDYELIIALSAERRAIIRDLRGLDKNYPMFSCDPTSEE